MTIQKIKSGRVTTVTADQYIGDIGTIFFNEGVGDLRLSDGQTPGGVPLTFGSGGGTAYILPTASTTVKGGVKVDGSTLNVNNQILSVVNGVFTTSSYSNPDWITSLAYSKLTGAPSIPTNTNQLTNGAGFITASSLTGYATESFVTGKGYITSSSLTWSNISGKPVLFSGNYNDLTNKPNLATVATSGNFNDLSNLPTIPTVPTNVSAFNNDANYLTSVSWSQVSGKPLLATVATSGSYTDLLGTPTIPDAQIQSDWNQTSNTSLDYIKNKPTLATVATSGDYYDLSNLPTIPSISNNNASIVVDSTGVHVTTISSSGTYEWSFGIDGILTLPSGSDVQLNGTSILNSGGSGQSVLWNWQGAYSDVPRYNEGDIVEYNGSTWRRNTHNLSYDGFPPGPGPGEEYWDYVALKGDTGAAGATGDTGVRGSKWFSGTDDPLATIPGIQDGDFYFKNTDNSIWQYAAGIQTWYLLSNITGPKGADGLPGTTDYTQLSNTPTSLSDFTNNVGFITSTDRLVSGDYTVLLDSNGALNIPNNGDWAHIQSPSNKNLNIQTLGDAFGRVQITQADGIKLYTNNDANSWQFDNNGGLVFPNSGGTQTVAYTGLPHLSDLLDVQIDSGSLTDFQVLSYFDKENKWINRTITIPSSTVFNVGIDPLGQGTLWYNTEDRRTYLYDGDQWVDIAPQIPEDVGFSGDYNDLDNKPVLFSGNYNDLTDKPILSTVAHSGNYDDLLNRPRLFSGDYRDLVHKPPIPAISNLSDVQITSLSHDQVLMYSAEDGKWENSNINFPPAIVVSDEPELTSAPWFNTTDNRLYVWNGTAWLDASPQMPYDGFSGDYNDLDNKPVLFSGDYADLRNKPNIPSIGTTRFTNNLIADPTNTISLVRVAERGRYVAGYTFGDDLSMALQYSHLYLDAVGTWSLGSNHFSTEIYSSVDGSGNPYNLNIASDGSIWTFNSDGDLSLPGKLVWPHMNISYHEGGGDSSLVITDGNGYTFTFEKGEFKLSENADIHFFDGSLQTTAPLYIGENAPTGYSFWYNTTDDRTYVNKDGIWVDASPQVPQDAGFSGDYNDLDNKPVLFSGNYDDLTNKPVLFSGSYNDLTNKPVIPPALPAGNGINGQVLTIDHHGNITWATGSSYNQSLNTSDSPTFAGVNITGYTAYSADSTRLGLPSTSITSPGTRTIFWPEAGAGHADYAMGMYDYTLWSSIPYPSSSYNFRWFAGSAELLKLQGDGKLVFADSTTYSGNTIIAYGGDFDIQSVGSTYIQTHANSGAKTFAFGSDGTLSLPHSELSGGSLISSDGDQAYRAGNNWFWFSAEDASLYIPVGSTIKDANGTNLIPSLSGYATESYVGTQIAALVDSAPSTLSTLKELADAIADNPNFATNISTALGNRLRVDASQSLTTDQQAQGRSNLGLATVASTGSYTDLTNKPTIPTNVSAFNNDSNYITVSSVTWTNLSGKPTLATVATSGSYTDLTNKPSLATVATSGSYTDLTNKPTIPAAQVNSDWNSVSGVTQILNKPALATVATSGSYTDLTNKPTFTAINANGTFSLPILTSTPANPQAGQVALADGVSWNPINSTSGTPYLMLYTGSAWVSLSGTDPSQVYKQILSI